MSCSNFASEVPFTARLQGRTAKEKRFSFTGGIDFLSSGHTSATCHRSKPSTDTAKTLVAISPSYNKIRKQASTRSTKTAPRPHTGIPREKEAFNVSNPSPRDARTVSYSSTLPPAKPTTVPVFRYFKRAIMDRCTPKDKAEGGSYATFFRKVFSRSKAEPSEGKKGVAKLIIPEKPVLNGVGSDLRDLRFFLGNESLKICRQLCRIQDDDEKHIHVLSYRVGSLPFSVRQFDPEEAPHNLLLPSTIVENTADDEEQEMMKVFMQNFIAMLPAGCDKISRKANPSGLVFRLLPSPIIPSAARYLGAAFWLWLCAIDDQIEKLGQKDFEEAIEEIKRVFNSESPSDPESRVVQTSFALRDLVERTELHQPTFNDVDGSNWRRSFLDAIVEILYAFEGERPLLDQFEKGDEKVKLADWMVLRLVTISARPFMVLARASLGLQPTLSPAGNTIKSVLTGVSTRRGRSDSAQTFTPDIEWEEDVSRLEVLAQCAMGLENDILGWEKDHAEENILNSVEILFQVYQHRQSAMREMVLMHNYVVNQMCLLAETVLHKYPETAPNSAVSPTHTLFRVDAFRVPNSLPPLIQASGLASPTSPETSNVKLLQRVKSKVHRGDFDRDEAVSGQVQYVMILLGFVQGMAVWTSKAKRYAV
ncbi:hypothetical protein TWF696_002921 [Orbilia brochopaga]|uniref:Uncharacterized protein n=1 Tax=Orbilia brochopaga TaxID=3140254 RepID=A0AAV9U0U4_9PEZI